MTQQFINVGAVPDDGNGDPLRTAFAKSNANFTELYGLGGGYVTDAELAAAGGSAAVGFIQAGTGAVSRTMQDKARESVSVKDFGAKGDNATDDTAAINAALTFLQSSGGGTLFFPRGWYLVSAPTLVTAENVFILGDGKTSTMIRSTVPNINIVSLLAINTGIQSITLGYVGTPVAGATALYIKGLVHARVLDFFILNAWIGIDIENGKAVYLDVLAIQDYGNSAIYCHDGSNDVFCSNFLFNCGLNTRGLQGGIRLYNKCEAIVFTKGDILKGAYSITTDAATNNFGQRPAYCTFTDVFFDSSDYGTSFNNSVLFRFTNCWWSNGRKADASSTLSADQPGCSVTGVVDGFSFSNCLFANSGTAGVYVGPTANRVMFSACIARGNGMTASTGVGFLIAGGTLNFSIIGCSAATAGGAGTQEWGIKTLAGASDRYNIVNNLVAGNTIGGVQDNGTGISKAVSGNW